MHDMTEMTIPMTLIDVLKHRHITGHEVLPTELLKRWKAHDCEGAEIGLEKLAERFVTSKEHLAIKLNALEK
jgi:hypothetical protein